MSHTPSDEWKASLKDVLARAASDADFREKCLTDPQAALREAGVDLPANTSIAFSETPRTSAITLPEFSGASHEITEEEILDGIAGGKPSGSLMCDYNPAHTVSAGGGNGSGPSPTC